MVEELVHLAVQILIVTVLVEEELEEAEILQEDQQAEVLENL
jgi:hypothetical protein